MYTPIQLEAIKMFGRKDLSFGCIFLNEQGYECTFIKKLQKPHSPNRDYIHCMFQGLVTDLGYDGYVKEILGHIPHLEDLFRVAGDKERGFVLNDESLFIFGAEIPYISYIPLIDQPNLEEIISLFK